MNIEVQLKNLNCHVVKPILKQLGDTNRWEDVASYAGFIYENIKGRYVLIGTYGSSIEGCKAYDDLHLKNKELLNEN